MARRDHLDSRGRSGARIALMCAVIGALLISGCSSPLSLPEQPEPAEAIREDVETIFGTLYGEDAVRAVLVQQHGELVYEQYQESTAEDTWDVRGVTRAVTSTLIGIAIDRGLISGVDATLGQLLPDYAAVLTPETAAIELRAVLTHTANFAPMSEERDIRGTPADLYAQPDWVAAILADRAARGPGDGRFLFSDPGTHVLAAVVAEVTGMSPFRFADEVLFDPLDIDTAPLWEERFTPDGDPQVLLQEYQDAEGAWPADPQGVNLGYTHLRLRATDLLRIGQLMLDEGVWDDEQVVSATWAVQATSPVVATVGYGTIAYGYHWWVDPQRGVFYAQGEGGTALVVDPVRDAVAVIASEVTIDDPRGNHGFASATAVGLAALLLADLSEDSR
ncbi:serine hydrolase domain-containing protein [Microbacterium trichothecenolyticum]|uniref:serine hydrolase domain-containing protein n=1 Tax=Microbacterium trichothecenolyticum TaxID=69370 RepID=UPI0035BE99F0